MLLKNRFIFYPSLREIKRNSILLLGTVSRTPSDYAAKA
jgi:hypothetical protein